MNKARQLGLFLEKYGVIRCRGRLQNAEYFYNGMYPILLPKNITSKI